jgi:hypothetical protein
LVVLNLLLGAAIYMRLGGERTANAQIGAGRSSYATVSGFSGGQAVVYILDVTNGNLIAVKTDPVNRTVNLVATKRVGQDLANVR